MVRMIASVPVVLMGGGIEPTALVESPTLRSEGLLAVEYIYQHGPDVFQWVSISRMAVIPIALFGTWLLWKIGSHFGNRNSGLFAAVLWTFSPMVLTHSATITSDIAGTVFGLWAAWCFYVWIRTGTIPHAIWLGISIAAAMLSKSTWIILPPLFIAIGLYRFLTGRSRTAGRVESLQVAGIVLISFFIIHAAYDFQGFMKPIGRFDFVSQTLSGTNEVVQGRGNRFRGTVLEWLPAPLPADYIRGMDVQKLDFEGRARSYLMGTWRDHGWWYYYVVGWLVKEPLAFWLILLVGVTGWTRTITKRNRLRTKWRGLLIVLGPGLFLFCFVSSQTGMNLHLRYVLPAFPAVFLFAAYLFHRSARPFQLTMMGLLIWFSLSSATMLPRSYAFFSQVIGGPQKGHLYLNASNLDWGQDLRTIENWVRENPEKRPVYLVYFPDYLDFQRLGIDAKDGSKRVSQDGPSADGWWLVSTNMCLNSPQSWFLNQTPTESLSVSTNVYHVRKNRRTDP